MIINYPLLIYHGAAPLPAGCAVSAWCAVTPHDTLLPPNLWISNILQITVSRVAGGRQGPEQVLGWSHLSSGSGSRQLLQCPGPASPVSLLEWAVSTASMCPRAPAIMGATVNWSLITGVGPNLSQIYWLYSPIPFYKWPINAVRAVMRVSPATSPALHFASVVTSRATTEPRPALATLALHQGGGVL